VSVPKLASSRDLTAVLHQALAMSQICLSSWLLLATLGISAGSTIECSSDPYYVQGAVTLDIGVSVNVSRDYLDRFGPETLSLSRDYFGAPGPWYVPLSGDFYYGGDGLALQYGSSGTDAWPKFKDQWVIKHYVCEDPTKCVYPPLKVKWDIIAVCESGCPASYLHSGRNESVWPKAGIFHAKWRFLVPVVTGDHIAQGTTEGDAFCCKRKPKVCDRLIDHCRKLDMPLLGCNPLSPATLHGCCEAWASDPWDIGSRILDSCRGNEQTVEFECDHSSAELETAHAVKDAVESVTFV